MKKALKMSKVLGTIRKKTNGGAEDSADPTGDGPEAVAARSVKSFCESGGPNNAGDEVLFLPPIVDAAESSPAAAAECARLIRKYLKKDYWTRPSYQYNAIMLIRILSDNPGPTFTRNLEGKFIDTVKELLKSVRDLSVRQMMMDTLDAFEHTKAHDEGLAPLIEMWKKEKEKATKQFGGPVGQHPVPRTLNAPAFNSHSQNYFSRTHSSRKLPDPVELAGRLEEARTSANLLQQVVTNTPPAEILDNDLIKEFADRCSSASKSVQGYMQAQDPAPDNETMESLIDTNEQLQNALSLHQRAVLNAKKQISSIGGGGDENALGPAADHREPNGLGIRQPSPSSSFEPPPGPPPRKTNGKGKEREYEPAIAGPSRKDTPEEDEAQDPFRDPEPEPASGRSYKSKEEEARATSRYLDQEPRLAFEPFHPGFETTPSYAGRQDSAIGKEAMHGGAAAEGGAGGAGNSGKGVAVSSAPRARKDDDDDDEDNIYDAPPTKPIYRY